MLNWIKRAMPTEANAETDYTDPNTIGKVTERGGYRMRKPA